MTTFKDLVVDEIAEMISKQEKLASESKNPAERCLHQTVIGVLKTVIEEGDIIEKQVV